MTLLLYVMRIDRIGWFKRYNYSNLSFIFSTGSILEDKERREESGMQKFIEYFAKQKNLC